MVVFIRRKLFKITTPKHISVFFFLHSQSFRSFQKDSTNVHSKNILLENEDRRPGPSFLLYPLTSRAHVCARGTWAGRNHKLIYGGNAYTCTRGERAGKRFPGLRFSFSKTPQAVLENEDRRPGPSFLLSPLADPGFVKREGRESNVAQRVGGGGGGGGYAINLNCEYCDLIV